MKILRLSVGGLSGLVATGAMTATMILLHRRLAPSVRYPLPPFEIIEAINPHQPAALKPVTTLFSHFGYGGVCGILFAILYKNPANWTPLRGALFGSMIWAVSYFGLLPRVGILKSATEHPASRSWLMLVAHWIWGGSLSVMGKLLLEDALNPNPALLQRHAIAVPDVA